jgi:hypothetical protein
MTFKPDITERINTDFGDDANKATQMLIDVMTKNDHLKSDRVIRCLIYLAKGDLEDLGNYIESAVNDPRDVMFWAEYSGITGSKTPTQIRDFTKTFDKAYSKNTETSSNPFRFNIGT